VAPAELELAHFRPQIELALLEPAADGFHNYVRKGLAASAAELLVDKAQLLNLTAPER